MTTPARAFNIRRNIFTGELLLKISQQRQAILLVSVEDGKAAIALRVSHIGADGQFAGQVGGDYTRRERAKRARIVAILMLDSIIVILANTQGEIGNTDHGAC